MMAEPEDNLRHALEEKAYARFLYADRTLFLASIAVSMKRIADALSGEGPNLFTTPINSYGEGIGDAIQGQLVRGQAGISQYDFHRRD